MAHTCHAPGCTVAVPPQLLACRSHWFALPGRLRAAIRAAYEPGAAVMPPAWRDAYAACTAFWMAGAR